MKLALNPRVNPPNFVVSSKQLGMRARNCPALRTGRCRGGRFAALSAGYQGTISPFQILATQKSSLPTKKILTYGPCYYYSRSPDTATPLLPRRGLFWCLVFCCSLCREHGRGDRARQPGSSRQPAPQPRKQRGGWGYSARARQQDTQEGSTPNRVAARRS